MFIKRLSLLFCVLPLLTISGCATNQNPATLYPQAPSVENFEPSYQKQLNASSHWGAIASDMADQLSAALNKNNIAEKPVYINLYSEKTEFGRAFQDFFTTHLVKKGVLVSKNKIGSTIYNYKIQPIKYQSNRTTSLPSKLRWTSLATGLIVVREIADFLDGDNETFLAAGVAADMWFGDTAPKLELIITSSVLRHEIYIHRSTDVYYANGSDIHLYQQQSNANTRGQVFDDPFYNLN